MSCVDICPIKNTLNLQVVAVHKEVRKKYVIWGVAGIFVIVTGLGMLTGYWQNNITKEEYLKYHENIEELGHPTDTETIKEMNEKTK